MKKTIADFVDDYLGEMVAGNAAIFAGAGLSVPAGFVDWRELIRPLSKELGLDIDMESGQTAIPYATAACAKEQTSDNETG